MRTTRALRVLQEKETDLLARVQRAASEAERLGGELRVVREVIKELAGKATKPRSHKGRGSVPSSSPVSSPNDAATAA